MILFVEHALMMHVTDSMMSLNYIVATDIDTFSLSVRTFWNLRCNFKRVELHTSDDTDTDTPLDMCVEKWFIYLYIDLSFDIDINSTPNGVATSISLAVK